MSKSRSEKKTKRPLFVYFIVFLILISSITMIVSMSFGIRDEMLKTDQLKLKEDYSSITAKSIVIVFCVFSVIVSMFLFFLRPITITLLYIWVVLLALLLVYAKFSFIVPIELIAGGALIEVMKRYGYKRGKLVLSRMVGIIPNKGDTVSEMRDIKKKLSKGIKSYKDIEEINK